MNILEVGKKRDEIMASQGIHCPQCSEKQFSPFDKLYVSLYDKCVDCSTSEEIEKNSDNVFKIIEA